MMCTVQKESLRGHYLFLLLGTPWVLYLLAETIYEAGVVQPRVLGPSYASSAPNGCNGAMQQRYSSRPRQAGCLGRLRNNMASHLDFISLCFGPLSKQSFQAIDRELGVNWIRKRTRWSRLERDGPAQFAKPSCMREQRSGG